MKMRDIASLSVGVDKVGVKNARNTLRGKEKNWKQTRKQCSNNAVSMLGISKFYIVKTEWKGTRISPAASGKRASTMQICIADLDALRKKKVTGIIQKSRRTGPGEHAWIHVRKWLIGRDNVDTAFVQEFHAVEEVWKQVHVLHSCWALLGFSGKFDET